VKVTFHDLDPPPWVEDVAAQIGVDLREGLPWLPIERHGTFFLFGRHGIRLRYGRLELYGQGGVTLMRESVFRVEAIEVNGDAPYGRVSGVAQKASDVTYTGPQHYGELCEAAFERLFFYVMRFSNHATEWAKGRRFVLSRFDRGEPV
jgi:hypothetical protein